MKIVAICAGVIVLVSAALISSAAPPSNAQSAPTPDRLKGFDQYMEQVLKDWNAPGVAVGVVVKNRLVLAKGYGYRDYEKKLPMTPDTEFQIASNTKLFTAMSVGMLVEEKKLEWDTPIRRSVPSIKFYNEDLDNAVTIRDMLSHRTGISRHDLIWYKSDFSRQELFERLRYLEPSQPIRQGFLYNNMMYAAAGQVVEVLSGGSWERFVRGRIFTPLGMQRSTFSAKEMERSHDHAVPYNEKRDSSVLYRIPIYEEAQGVGPAGSIISSVHDMSRWLTALMNGGRIDGRQVLPEGAVRATLEPSVALPNTALETRGYRELLNPVYGMGRWFAAYRGHYLAFHGGDLPGLHSQVSCMPYDSIGVVVFVIGDHAAPLYNVITYNVYERLLGLDLTPWSERRLKDRLEAKAAGTEGRKKAGAERVSNAPASHPLADYAGQYEHPAYGIISITKGDSTLAFQLHHISLPLRHFHYDRFDTPDDQEDGLYSLNFGTSPQGEIDRLTVSLDEAQVTFIRKADAALRDPRVLEPYVGRYKLAGAVLEVQLTGGSLWLVPPGSPRIEMLPYRPAIFKAREFADLTFEFILQNRTPAALVQRDPSGEYRFERVR